MAIYTESHILDIEFNRMIKSIDENCSFDIDVLEEGADIKSLVDKLIKKIKEFFKAILNKIKEFIKHKNTDTILSKAPKSIKALPPGNDKLTKVNDYLKENPIIVDIDMSNINLNDWGDSATISWGHKYTHDEAVKIFDKKITRKYINSINNDNDLKSVIDFIENVDKGILENNLRAWEKHVIEMVDPETYKELVEDYIYNFQLFVKYMIDEYLKGYKTAIIAIKMLH